MTERQRAFARFYAADPLGNKAEAARKAGCTPKSAAVTANKWLKNANVQAEITLLRAKTEIKLDITAEKVLKELSRIAFLDIRKIFTEEGALRPIHELDDETAAAIAGLEHEKLFDYFGKGQAKHIGTTSKLKLADKLRALELLGKWHKLKLFSENIEVSGTVSLADVIRQRRTHASANRES
jgi:phage terminase small subunit